MRKTIQAALPHLVILICNMYIVFFLIDRVNPAMNFIDNGLTKGLLLILIAATAILAVPLAFPRRNKRGVPAYRRGRGYAAGSRRPSRYGSGGRV